MFGSGSVLLWLEPLNHQNAHAQSCSYHTCAMYCTVLVSIPTFTMFTLGFCYDIFSPVSCQSFQRGGIFGASPNTIPRIPNIFTLGFYVNKMWQDSDRCSSWPRLGMPQQRFPAFRTVFPLGFHSGTNDGLTSTRRQNKRTNGDTPSLQVTAITLSHTHTHSTTLPPMPEAFLLVTVWCYTNTGRYLSNVDAR